MKMRFCVLIHLFWKENGVGLMVVAKWWLEEKDGLLGLCD
jgi:hypothetical protein